jgi:hypothetical protein
MAAPMPPINQDPAILRGYALRQAFDLECTPILADTTLSDLGMAQKIAALYAVVTTDIAAARDDYKNRRAARTAELAQVVPIGPDVPPDASPADKAVLMQAWRTTLADARECDRDGRSQMLAEAERFDDDTVRRAALTAASDNGEGIIINQWASTRPECAAQLRELLALRDSYVMDGMAARQAFGPIPVPTEMANLPTLLANAERERQLFTSRGLIRPGPATGLFPRPR